MTLRNHQQAGIAAGARHRRRNHATTWYGMHIMERRRHEETEMAAGISGVTAAL